MNFVTNSVTTIYLSPYHLQYREVKSVFLSLYIVEGDIYGAYCHQNTFKSMISLLKKPVFIVVTELVTLFEWDREYEKTAVTTLGMGHVKHIYWSLARQYHPDKGGGNGDVMKGINLFYEAIKQF